MRARTPDESSTLPRFPSFARPRAWVFACALGALATATHGTLATPAWAQSASDLAAAKQLFSEGLKLESSGKWAEARDKFVQVEAVKQTPQVTFHIGLCHARLGALVESLVWLERAKERAQQARAADVESAADAELKAVRPRVPSLEIVVPKDATILKVMIDGEQSRTAATGAPVLVNPGDRDVAVEFANGTVTKRVKVVERDATKVPIEPPKGPARVAAVPPPAPPPPSAAGETPAKPTLAVDTPPPGSDTTGATARGAGVLPWVLVGGGVLAAGGGTALVLTSIASFREVCPDVCPREKATEAQTARDSAVGPYYAGLALIGAGVVAAGVGVVLFATAPSRPSASTAASLRLAPAPLPGGGGLSVAGQF